MPIFPGCMAIFSGAPFCLLISFERVLGVKGVTNGNGKLTGKLHHRKVPTRSQTVPEFLQFFWMSGTIFLSVEKREKVVL